MIACTHRPGGNQIIVVGGSFTCYRARLLTCNGFASIWLHNPAGEAVYQARGQRACSGLDYEPDYCVIGTRACRGSSCFRRCRHCPHSGRVRTPPEALANSELLNWILDEFEQGQRFGPLAAKRKKPPMRSQLSELPLAPRSHTRRENRSVRLSETPSDQPDQDRSVG